MHSFQNMTLSLLEIQENLLWLLTNPEAIISLNV